jgi:hypothetical protein
MTGVYLVRAFTCLGGFILNCLRIVGRNDLATSADCGGGNTVGACRSRVSRGGRRDTLVPARSTVQSHWFTDGTVAGFKDTRGIASGHVPVASVNGISVLFHFQGTPKE